MIIHGRDIALLSSIATAIQNEDRDIQKLFIEVAGSGVLFPHRVNIMNSLFNVYEKKENKFSQETKKRYSKIRYITEAKEPLKHMHKVIYNSIALRIHGSVHSYLPEKSSLTAVQGHVGAEEILIIDIRDFFPSITRPMIEALYLREFNTYTFSRIEYSTSMEMEIENLYNDYARIISVLCSMQDPRGKNHTNAVLPIGIEPASKISNSILYPVDDMIYSLCGISSCFYTRYSDNIMISPVNGKLPSGITESVINIIESFIPDGARIPPFKVNMNKVTVKKNTSRMRVLGIIANKKPNISSHREAWIRSRLTHIKKDLDELEEGLASGRISFEEADAQLKIQKKKINKAFGHLSYTMSINKDKADKYSAHRASIKMKYSHLSNLIWRRASC